MNFKISSPFSDFDGDLNKFLPDSDADFEKFINNREYVFLLQGRDSFSHILKHYDVSPADEVWITTSSESSYVSSCVTCSIFNYCKPARVFSENTKGIVIIHEFGKPHPETDRIITLAQKSGLWVMEDCAHSWDSYFKDTRVGNFGDFILYSLPKIFPVKSGGILVSKRALPEIQFDDADLLKIGEIEEQFVKLFPYLAAFSRRRKENFLFLREKFRDQEVLFEFGEDITPYLFPLITKKSKYLYTEFSGCGVEWIRPYVKDWFLIPIHPFIKRNVLEEMAIVIRSKL